jgi:cell division protein FtsW
MRTAFPALDRSLLFILVLLLLFGTVMLYSAASPEVTGGPEWGGKMLFRRTTQIMIGLALLFFMALMDLRIIRRLAPWAWGISFALLVAVLFLPGNRGTKGWLLGQSIQVVEVARVTTLVYMASLLAKRAELKSIRERYLAPVLLLTASVLPVVLQPDFGSALALSLCGGLLLVAARLPKRIILLGLVFLAAVSLGGYQLSDRIQSRIDSTYRVDVTQLEDDTYQLGQSLIGIGAGGLAGEGLGKSRQKSFFLPDHHTDFIFAIVGEELGIWGTLGALTLLGFLLWRMMLIAFAQSDAFSRNLVAAMAAMIFVYTGLNLSVSLGLFPLTGLPLPFFSHGGSALVMNMAGVGLVLSVARGSQDRPRALKRARREGEPVLENLYQEPRS